MGEFTKESFERTLGDLYDIFKGKFKEEKFEGLLNEYNFCKSISGREKLRIALKEDDFFEKGSPFSILVLKIYFKIRKPKNIC